MTAQVIPFRERSASKAAKTPRPLVQYARNGLCCFHGTKEQLIDWGIVPSEDLFPVLPKRVLYHHDPVSEVYSIGRIKGGLFECVVLKENWEQFCKPFLVPPNELRSEDDVREFLAAITSTLAVQVFDWTLAPLGQKFQLEREAYKTKDQIAQQFVSAAMEWARTAKIDEVAS